MALTGQAGQTGQGGAGVKKLDTYARKFLTVYELAHETGMSERLVRRLTALSVIPVYRFSAKCVRYRLGEVEEAVKAFRHGGVLKDG